MPGQERPIRGSSLLNALPKPAVAPFRKTESASFGAPLQDAGLLERWNSMQRPVPLDRCIHELVAEQARASPGAPAVVCAERTFRYDELERLSNRLAHLLRQRGVGPEVCVGLLAERSPEMIVGALAILKAGGAYVPLDPSYPAERIAFLLRDADVGIVLVQPGAENSLPGGLRTPEIESVMIDLGADALVEFSAEAPVSGVTPKNLAYVIYTSGSTGQPKGVEITHANVLNLIFWHWEAFGVSPEDRATLLSSPGFDASVWETWPYLAAGASLYLPEDSARLSPEALRDWIQEKAITISFAPTALAEPLVRLSWKSDAALRFLLTGGDVLHQRPPAGLPFEFVNNYGPTECTVVATSGRVSPQGSEEGLPSIGRPIANTEAWILDESLQLVPIRQPGELFISGAGLARGYRNRPDLTAERFLTHTPGDVLGGSEKVRRMYRTGDLARFLPDGQIAFLGRADSQIKIRGHRIEPDEVSLALNRHPGVAGSAVVASEGAEGEGAPTGDAAEGSSAREKRLVAYFVCSPGASPPKERDLMEYLRAILPEYMIPSSFVSLEALPLTPHGKIDRRALAAMQPTRARSADPEYIAPRTPIEERLAAILASLMGLERVSVHENFFLLGGHSLLGTQVIARIRDSFGVELPLRSLFDAPTVADLSAEIERLILAKLETSSADGSRQK